MSWQEGLEPSPPTLNLRLHSLCSQALCSRESRVPKKGHDFRVAGRAHDEALGRRAQALWETGLRGSPAVGGSQR